MTESQQPQKLPIGVQNFEKLITEGYIYIDKTDYIHRLVTTGSYYFLSRPRRFGKSLLLSTLHAYFSGRKELFEGLKISELEQDWTEYPVLHLDLNTQNYNRTEALSSILNDYLTQWEDIYGRKESETDLGLRFKGVIQRAFERTGRKVVVLVDEYDKPMLQAIGDEPLLIEFRNILKGFYGVLKSMDGCIRFAFLTGVTKFSKVSVFSDLNNLEDISMSEDYACICGITHGELTYNLIPYIDVLAAKFNYTRNECIEKLRKTYDGYHFCEYADGVYNPFSLLNALKDRNFKSYWFETGTPTYLVELLQAVDYNLESMANTEATEDVLSSVNNAATAPIAVIYQGGYLTIKDFDPQFRIYTLGFPNEEVEGGFMRFLLPMYTSVKVSETPFHIKKFVQEISSGQTESFLKRLREFFADTPYELIKNLENHYQNVLFILCRLLGLYVHAEYHTSEGRIDMVLQSGGYCYVMEFKLDGTAEQALQQIDDKHYAQPFEAAGNCRIIRVGLNFSSETRNIDRWVIAWA